MKYRSFWRSLGWPGAISWIVALTVLALQVWQEVTGSPEANPASWAVVGAMVGLMVVLMVHLHFHVRRHNAKVDEERAREQRWLEYMDGPSAK